LGLILSIHATPGAHGDETVMIGKPVQ
jgi:hypothetical protein